MAVLTNYRTANTMAMYIFVTTQVLIVFNPMLKIHIVLCRLKLQIVKKTMCVIVLT